MRDRDLIKGHYYTIVNTDEKCYFKFDYLGYLYYYLRGDGKYYDASKPFLLRNNYDFEEVCLSEFVEYLPSNHPDKICFRKQRINKLLYDNI